MEGTEGAPPPAESDAAGDAAPAAEPGTNDGVKTVAGESGSQTAAGASGSQMAGASEHTSKKRKVDEGAAEGMYTIEQLYNN